MAHEGTTHTQFIEHCRPVYVRSLCMVLTLVASCLGYLAPCYLLGSRGCFLALSVCLAIYTSAVLKYITSSSCCHGFLGQMLSLAQNQGQCLG